MDRASRETWAKRVERWKQSELTAKEFATELGISVGALKWWKWRLSADRKPGAPKPRARRTRSKVGRATQVPALTFVEMPAPLAATTTDTIEVVLPTSTRIRVRPGFDDATLRRVLEVLEQRR